MSSLDAGTWRRLIVIPFNARIEGDGDIKNYAEYLFQHAGGAILTWLLEGAKAAIDTGFKIDKPAAVLEAIAIYREQNDWLGQFIAESCVIGSEDSCQVSTLDLYRAYHNHSLDRDEYIRRPNDFYVAIEGAGYKRKTIKRKKCFVGIRLRTEEDDDRESKENGDLISPESNEDGFPDFLM